MVLFQDLTYHLGAEERKGKHVLVVQIHHKGLPLATGLTQQFLLSCPEPQEKRALQEMIAEDLKSPSSRAGTGSLFSIRSEKAHEIVRALSLTRKLYFGNAKLFFDPFSNLSFFYEASILPDDRVVLKGRWAQGQT